MRKVISLLAGISLGLNTAWVHAQEDFAGFEQVIGMEAASMGPEEGRDAVTPPAPEPDPAQDAAHKAAEQLSDLQRRMMLGQREADPGALEAGLRQEAAQLASRLSTEAERAAPGKAPEQARDHEASSPKPATEQIRERTSEDGSKVITVTSGKNVILPVSLGQLNRIITPFDAPVISSTVDPQYVTIQKNKNVISFGTNLRKPIGVFISPEDDPEVAISLTLVPVDRVQPQQVTIQLEGYQPASPEVEAIAEPEYRRVSNSYLEWVQDLALSLAKGHTPQGFSLGAPAQSDVCTMPGIRMTPVQLLSGMKHRIVVYRAENTTSTPQSVKEQYCWKPSVNFVMAWEKVLLNPGDKSEIFVVEKISSTMINQRPSTLEDPS